MVARFYRDDAGADFADMVADCRAAGFLAKDELSAAAIQRILARA